MRKLRAGDLVEVRSIDEILSTLDATGTLDGLLFMPEMAQFCGQRFRVFKRAEKVNDTVARTGLRRMRDTVLLENVRCDGSFHGGCQSLCQILWKEDWLKPPTTQNRQVAQQQSDYEHTEQVLETATLKAGSSSCEMFRCQATEIRNASTFLAWWDIRQYVRDVSSGNVTACDVFRAFGFWLVMLLVRVGPYRLWVRLYNALQRLRGGEPFPYVNGRLQKTPSVELNLQPGELVRVKSHEEILQTLDVHNRNRGLWFDVEMVKYCGGTFRVLKRVNRIIDVATGRMLQLPMDSVILEDVTVRGDYHRFYPQNEYPLWREIWLTRIHEQSATAVIQPKQAVSQKR
jgi:hypothetical protein